LLNNCESITDVETLLEHSPISEAVHLHDNENWNIALWNNCKQVVSHPYYQNFLRQKLNGVQDQEKDQDQKQSLMSKFGFVLLSLSLPLTYPFVIFVDVFFGDNDLVFIPPEKLRSIYPDKRDNKVKGFYRSAMHKPISRIYFHHLMELIFLIVLCLSSIDPYDTVNNYQLWWYDYILAIFVISYITDDILEFFRRGWATLNSFWHVFYFCNHLMLFLGAILMSISAALIGTDNRQGLSGNHPANVGGAIFAFAALAALLRPLRWLLLNKTLGPVVICVIRVFRDVFHISVITIIMVGAIAIGSFNLLKPFELNKEHSVPQSIRLGETETYVLHESNMVEFKGMIRGFAWRLFDSGHPEYFTVRKCNATQKNSTASDFCKSLNKNDAEIDPGSISYEFSHFMGLVLWFLYQFLLVMILMNILIAMMTTTFTRISETANIQWRYTKSFYQVEFLHSKTILPAPLR